MKGSFFIVLGALLAIIEIIYVNAFYKSESTVVSLGVTLKQCFYVSLDTGFLRLSENKHTHKKTQTR